MAVAGVNEDLDLIKSHCSATPAALVDYETSHLDVEGLSEIPLFSVPDITIASRAFRNWPMADMATISGAKTSVIINMILLILG